MARPAPLFLELRVDKGGAHAVGEDVDEQQQEIVYGPPLGAVAQQAGAAEVQCAGFMTLHPLQRQCAKDGKEVKRAKFGQLGLGKRGEV